jgi:hypothetical protein
VAVAAVAVWCAPPLRRPPFLGRESMIVAHIARYVPAYD